MWSSFTIETFNLLKPINYINKNFTKNIKNIRDLIIKNNDTKFKITKIKISKSKINKFKDSQWVDPNFYYDNLTFDINITWINNNLTNNIYLKTTENKFDEIINKLHIFIKILNFIQGQSKIEINLYLVLSQLKKKIEFNKIISPKHINSGYTNIITKEIFIWREEEFEKVSFHELIHLFDHDHRDEVINLDLDINGPESFFEAITDFKAIIYNIIYISLLSSKKIESLIKFEIAFMYNQAIFVFFHLSNCMSNNTIIQKSPAYSYFILKYYIFEYFINAFNQELFTDIFFKGIKYRKLIKLINFKNLKDCKYVDFKSARMTLFEMN
jgi:hypothetical protein